ncbi:ALWAYS EARLY 3-like protein [Tanacetum coccineum]
MYNPEAFEISKFSDAVGTDNEINDPWFLKREFAEYFYLVGLGHVPRLTRVKWGVIRRRRLLENLLMILGPKSLGLRNFTGQASFNIDCFQLTAAKEGIANRVNTFSLGLHANNRRTRRHAQGPPLEYTYMGNCDQIYRHCGAFFWYEERTRVYMWLYVFTGKCIHVIRDRFAGNGHVDFATA